MPIRNILLLGDPRLYEPSTAVEPHELASLHPAIADLHDTMAAFQHQHGWGRAIAAPQIGVHKRIVCMRTAASEDTGSQATATMPTGSCSSPGVQRYTTYTFINPVLDQHSDETQTFWEDCMSFPELLVRLENPVSCRLTYRDLEWREYRVRLTGDYAELLQHEVDHLDGVLSIQRAVDNRSIVLRRAMPDKSAALVGDFVPLL